MARTPKGKAADQLQITEPTSGKSIVEKLDAQKAAAKAAQQAKVLPANQPPSARTLAGRVSAAQRTQMTRQALGAELTEIESQQDEGILVTPRTLSAISTLRKQVQDSPENHLPTALQSEESFYAIRYVMGQRYYYNLVCPISEIATVLPRPDPERPAPGNRRVKLSHAKDCAGYVRANPYYAMPALIIRGPDKMGWEELTPPVNGISLGLLRIPKSVRLELGVLDGQHRILGFDLAMEDIQNEIQIVQAKITQSNAKGDAESVQELGEAMEILEEQKERLMSESIAVQIMIENEDHAYRQAFADIADNAMGITSAVRARFDTRKVANRALEEVLHHELLKDHIEMDSDRVVGESTAWLSAKHVADLIRILEVGNSGRMGKGREEDLDEGHLVEQSNTFFDILAESFPLLVQMADNVVTTKELRNTSLLGSATTIRVLAGVVHKLRGQLQDEDFVDFFSGLADTMSAPINTEHQWLGLPGIELTAKAPSARRQDVEDLVKALCTLMVGVENVPEDEEGQSAA